MSDWLHFLWHQHYELSWWGKMWFGMWLCRKEEAHLLKDTLQKLLMLSGGVWTTWLPRWMQQVLVFRDLAGWYVHYWPICTFLLSICAPFGAQCIRSFYFWFIVNQAMRSILARSKFDALVYFTVQWLGLNKELHRLSVETTSNQVCGLSALDSMMGISLVSTLCFILHTWSSEGWIHQHVQDCEADLHPVSINRKLKVDWKLSGYTGVKGPRTPTWNWCLGTCVLPAGSILPYASIWFSFSIHQ